MAAVEQLGEHAVGDRRRQVAKLQQPMQAQLPHAIDFPLLEARPHHHVGDELEAAIQKSLQRRQADDGGVVADVGLELCADPAQRFVDIERGTIAAAFVEHVRGDGGQARSIARVGGRARRARAAAR